VPRNPFLQPTFLVTSTRRDITFGGCCRAPWVNPPAFDSRSSPGPRFRIAGEDARPPCGHPASNSRALDGALQASGPSTATLMRFRAGRKERCGLVSRTAAPSMGNPLTPLFGRPAGGLPEQPATCRLSSLLSGHVNATGFPEPEMPSTGGDHASALARARRERCHAGRRGSRRTPSSMFENID
jgi:hypothetical protein